MAKPKKKWITNGKNLDYNLLRQYSVGRPKATKTYTVAELEKQGIRGYYEIIETE